MSKLFNFHLVFNIFQYEHTYSTLFRMLVENQQLYYDHNSGFNKENMNNHRKNAVCEC